MSLVTYPFRCYNVLSSELKEQLSAAPVCAYMDDVSLVVGDPQEARAALQAIQDIGCKLGFLMNAKKTKVHHWRFQPDEMSYRPEKAGGGSSKFCITGVSSRKPCSIRHARPGPPLSPVIPARRPRRRPTFKTPKPKAAEEPFDASKYSPFKADTSLLKWNVVDVFPPNRKRSVTPPVKDVTTPKIAAGTPRRFLRARPPSPPIKDITRSPRYAAAPSPRSPRSNQLPAIQGGDTTPNMLQRL